VVAFADRFFGTVTLLNIERSWNKGGHEAASAGWAVPVTAKEWAMGKGTKESW
jgi:hypothetical protein